MERLLLSPALVEDLAANMHSSLLAEAPKLLSMTLEDKLRGKVDQAQQQIRL